MSGIGRGEGRLVVRTIRGVLRRAPGLRRVMLTVRFGDVTRTTPLTSWGTGRGTPVDRWYIERYLESHAAAVFGRVLEVKSDAYGSGLGASQVEVVDIDPANTRATIIGDLCDPQTLQLGRYNVAIVTQTLQFVADPHAALCNILAALRPGGTLLLTVPSLSRVCDASDRWRWTPAGLEDLLHGASPRGTEIQVCGLGNGLSGRAFLFGLAAEDLTPSSLAVDDRDYPLVVAARVGIPV